MCLKFPSCLPVVWFHSCLCWGCIQSPELISGATLGASMMLMSLELPMGAHGLNMLRFPGSRCWHFRYLLVYLIEVISPHQECAGTGTLPIGRDCWDWLQKWPWVLVRAPFKQPTINFSHSSTQPGGVWGSPLYFNLDDMTG